MNSVGNWDRQISKSIIHLDEPALSPILFFFSSIFHPKMIWLPIGTVYYLSKNKLGDTAIYTIGILACLIITTVLKRRFKRPRPDLLEQVKKSQAFRRKEKNCAMPSGDTVQSMFFSMIIVLWFDGNLLLMAIFHILVAISRVYFMCHWIGDTVAATIITYPVGLVFTLIREQHGLGLQRQLSSMIYG